MKPLISCIAFALILLASPHSHGAGQNTVPPQAEPVLNWIKASRSGDVALVKSVWTADTYNNFFGGDKTNWRRYLKESAKMWREIFGVRNLRKLNLGELITSLMVMQALGSCGSSIKASNVKASTWRMKTGNGKFPKSEL